MTPTGIFVTVLAVACLAAAFGIGANVERARWLKLEAAANAEAARQVQIARSQERAAVLRAEGIAYAAEQRASATRASTAHAQRAARSMRDEVARLNARPAPADANAATVAREAAQSRELLAQCSTRYSRVAGDADELRDQVVGLLDFTATVCHARVAAPVVDSSASSSSWSSGCSSSSSDSWSSSSSDSSSCSSDSSSSGGWD